MVAERCAEDDLRCAEVALYELALVLRRVRVDEYTHELHVRVLRLKRDVARWPSEMPELAERSAVLDELRRMQREAAQWDKGAVSGVRRRDDEDDESAPRGSGSRGDGTT